MLPGLDQDAYSYVSSSLALHRKNLRAIEEIKIEAEDLARKMGSPTVTPKMLRLAVNKALTKILSPTATSKEERPKTSSGEPSNGQGHSPAEGTTGVPTAENQAGVPDTEAGKIRFQSCSFRDAGLEKASAGQSSAQP